MSSLCGLRPMKRFTSSRISRPMRSTRVDALTEVDGKILPGSTTIQLEDDGAAHTIRIVMG